MMPISTSGLSVLLLALAAMAYALGYRRARRFARGTTLRQRTLALPAHYATYALLWAALPAAIVLAAWLALEPALVRQVILAELPATVRALPEGERDLYVNRIVTAAREGEVLEDLDPALRREVRHYLRVRAVSRMALAVVVLTVSAGGMAWAVRRISPRLPARQRVERVTGVVLQLCAMVAIFTTIGIVLSLLFEALRFFRSVPPAEFLFGLQWSPQTALRADQVGSSGAFGSVPLFAGTFLISAIAMAVAVPVGLMSAVYLSEYATPRTRAVAKPALEILAGIPTVVYGFFAALTVAPLVRRAGEAVGLDVSSESALAAGLVMGIMIIPFVSSLADDVMTAVPRSLRDGSLALGATRSETIKRVVFAAALPGIVAGILLAVSRAIGETMIVVMAAGLTANLTANPLEAVTTVTVQIVTLLTGDQEFDSPKTLAAFALGLVLFAVTLALNIVALHIVRKYREQYE